jgi:hypothetical protein
VYHVSCVVCSCTGSVSDIGYPPSSCRCSSFRLVTSTGTTGTTVELQSSPITTPSLETSFSSDDWIHSNHGRKSQHMTWCIDFPSSCNDVATTLQFLHFSFVRLHLGEQCCIAMFIHPYSKCICFSTTMEEKAVRNELEWDQRLYFKSNGGVKYNLGSVSIDG